MATDTMIKYVGFDSDGGLAVYSDEPIANLDWFAVADIGALWRDANGWYVDTGARIEPVSEWDWLTLIRDLRFHFCATSGDYLPRREDCEECYGCATMTYACEVA